jgi:hypothetical protein
MAVFVQNKMLIRQVFLPNPASTTARTRGKFLQKNIRVGQKHLPNKHFTILQVIITLWQLII